MLLLWFNFGTWPASLEQGCTEETVYSTDSIFLGLFKISSQLEETPRAAAFFLFGYSLSPLHLAFWMAGSKREKIRNCIKGACPGNKNAANNTLKSTISASSCWNVAILTRVSPRGNQESHFAVSHSKWRGGERERGVGPRHQTAGNALLTQPPTLILDIQDIRLCLRLGAYLTELPLSIWCAILADKEEGDNETGGEGTCCSASPATSPPHDVLAVTGGGRGSAGQGGRTAQGATNFEPEAGRANQSSSHSGPLAPRHRSQPLGRRGPPNWQLSISAAAHKNRKFNRLLNLAVGLQSPASGDPPSFVELREILSPRLFWGSFHL